MNMPRTHTRNLGNTYDTVASHSYHLSVIAYCICRMEGLSHEDGIKSIAMGVFHDLEEARAGDLDFISKHYNEKNEHKAIKDTFTNIEFGKDLEEMVEEYESKKSKVAKCVKDADLIEQMYQEWYLMWQGNKMAQKWFEFKLESILPNLYTESGKKIVEEMRNSHPHEWWWSEFIEKDYDSKKLVGKLIKS